METNRDNNFFNQVEKYEKSIQRIFNKAIDEAISRGLVREDLIRNGQFSFDNLPSTKKEADKLFKQLNNTLVDEIRKGIEFAWDSRNEKLIEYFREKGVQEDVLSVLKTRNQSAMLGFQNRKENGLRLSNRVWNITKSFKQDMEIALEVSISQGKSASIIASELKNLLQNPDALYRRVRNEQGNLVLSRQAKAFNPGQGVYRSAYKNAFRLARTETNMAYQLSANTRYNSLDFVIGQRVMLSNNPNHCEMCEAFEGEYPKEFIFRSWHPQCYDKETEVMTSSGWKLFKDVNHSDKIMSLNPETKQPEWVKWAKTFAYRHKGKVIKFHNKALDMVVTPDHRMVYLSSRSSKILYKDADSFNSGSKYRSSEYDSNCIESINVGGKNIPFDLYCEFMGYYLTDGSYSENRINQISISQDKHKSSEQYKTIETLLNKFPLDKMTPTKDYFYIRDEVIYNHVRQFGKSSDKFIPKEILTASPRQIKIFLDAFILCDGIERMPRPFKGNRGNDFTPKSTEREYYTSSNVMAMQLGELLLKISKRPSYSYSARKGDVQEFSNGTYTINNDNYIIRECKGKTSTAWNKEYLDYDDYVYDLELERNHILYVRRNGKCVWGSNCRCTSIPILKSQFEMQRDRKRKRQGLEPLPTKGVIKDIPFALRDWVIENRNKLETKPTYFFKDNRNFFN